MFKFFKKKEKEVINVDSKYKVGEFVSFRYRGDIRQGFIYSIDVVSQDEYYYTVQLGGECPSLVYKIEEKSIFPVVKRY